MTVRRVVLVAAIAVAGLTAATEALAQAPPAPDPRLSRLELWIETVLTHQPNEFDEGSATIGSWRSAELRTLWLDMNAVVALMRFPTRTNFSFKLPDLPSSQPVRYTVDQLRRVRLLACATGGVYRHPECALLKLSIDQDPALTHIARLASAVREGDDTNFILRRAAIVHSDINILGLASAVDPLSIGLGPSAPFRVTIADGRETSVTQSAAHWEIARRLLDQVMPVGASKPAPEKDDMVRAWYRATAAWMQHQEHHDTIHHDRARDLFPNDPDLLFLSGCLHESYASTPIQAAVRSAVLPSGVRIAVGTERGELRDAEQLFRRAVDIRPEFPEARLRHGRVLALLGRDTEAVSELRKAMTAIDVSSVGSKESVDLLTYFAGLFLGSAEETLGHFDVAQAAYQRAASLYPEAQSPRLALSQLARRSGKREAALATIDEVFRIRMNHDESDPWWAYYRVQGRNADQLLGELERPFVIEAQR